MENLKRVLICPVSKLRPDIQALRALAVLSVILYHLFPDKVHGGFMGVDIFFVISGYLMTTTLLQALNEMNERDSRFLAATSSHTVPLFKRIASSFGFLVAFYAKRIKRLAPASVVCLSVVLIAVFAFGHYAIMKDTAEQVFHSSIFTQNLYLADQQVDYLGSTKADTAVQHFWSLSVEEQFYMIWPMLLLAVTLIGIRLARRDKNKLLKTFGKNLVGTVIVLFTLVFFYYGIELTTAAAPQAYFFTPARIWELALGGIICFLPSLEKLKAGFIGILALILTWVSFGLCVFALLSVNGLDFPGIKALIPTLCTALIIYLGPDTNRTTCTNSVRATSRVTTFSFVNLSRIRPVQFVGNISYSLYLYYCPVITLLPLFLPEIDLAMNRTGKLVALLIVFAFATASYFFIEQPTRRLKKKPLTVIVAGIILGGIVVSGSLYVKDYAENQMIDFIHAARDKAADSTQIRYGARAILHQEEYGNPYGVFDKNFETFRFEDNVYNRAGIYPWYITRPQESDTGNWLGDEDSENIVLAVGDSHTQMYQYIYDKIGQENTIKFIFGIHRSARPEGGSYVGSQEYNDYYLNILLEHIDIISTLLINWKDPWVLDEEGVAMQHENVSNLISVARQNNIRVVFIQDVPTQNSFQESEDDTELMNYLLSNGFLKEREIVFTQDYLCDENGFAPAYIGGVPVYAETTDEKAHFTQTFQMTFYEVIAPRLLEALTY